MSEQAFDVGSFSSQAVRIYLNRPGFDVLDRSVWEANEIFSFTEGIVDHLPGGGYFVEEQNSSVLWVIQDGLVRYKNVLVHPTTLATTIWPTGRVLCPRLILAVCGSRRSSACV